MFRVSGPASVKKIVSKLISVLFAGWECDRKDGSGIRRNACSTIPSVTCGGAAATGGGPLPEQTKPMAAAGGGATCQSLYSCCPGGQVLAAQVLSPFKPAPHALRHSKRVSEAL